jgi:hypothetical protein
MTQIDVMRIGPAYKATAKGLTESAGQTTGAEKMVHHSSSVLLKEDAVGYHRPHYGPQITKANGVEYSIERGLSGDEIRRLGAEIDQIPRAALIPIGDRQHAGDPLSGREEAGDAGRRLLEASQGGRCRLATGAAG